MVRIWLSWATTVVSPESSQRVALPVAPRVSQPLAKVAVQVRTPVERNDSHVVGHLYDDGDIPRTISSID